METSCHGFCRKARRIAHGLVLERGADEAVEQGMAVARRRGELRMELAGHEPRMLLRRQFDHFDEQVVHRFAGDDEAQVLELLAIAVIEFVAMPMALANDVLAVQIARNGTGLQPAFLRAQPHRAAEIGIFAALLDVTRARRPLSDQRDYRMRAMALVLARIRAFEPGNM